MKKFVCVLMAMVLMMTASAAYAGGLGGLSGAGTQGGSSGLLPDPCLAMEHDDDVGRLMMADYQFADDYLCDAYVYPKQGMNFVSSYTKLLRDFGYTIAETSVDGMAGYSISCGDGYEALMVLDFEGETLLLVEKGMDFLLTNVLTCNYNGHDYSMYRYIYFTPESFPYNCWNAHFNVENAPFEMLSIDVPKYAHAGDAFEVDDPSDSYEGLNMEIYRDYNYVRLLEGEVSFYRVDGIESKKDNFHMYITRMEETSEGMLIAGTFDGSFYGGDEVFENGRFCAMIPQ